MIELVSGSALGVCVFSPFFVFLLSLRCLRSCFSHRHMFLCHFRIWTAYLFPTSQLKASLIRTDPQRNRYQVRDFEPENLGGSKPVSPGPSPLTQHLGFHSREPQDNKRKSYH